MERSKSRIYKAIRMSVASTMKNKRENPLFELLRLSRRAACHCAPKSFELLISLYFENVESKSYGVSSFFPL